jgi:hypothetical protein
LEYNKGLGISISKFYLTEQEDPTKDFLETGETRNQTLLRNEGRGDGLRAAPHTVKRRAAEAALRRRNGRGENSMGLGWLIDKAESGKNANVGINVHRFFPDRVATSGRKTPLNSDHLDNTRDLTWLLKSGMPRLSPRLNQPLNILDALMPQQRAVSIEVQNALKISLLARYFAEVSELQGLI